MNISPVSNNLYFGKLHIENNKDNKDFLTMVCANKMAAPARQFAAMDWASGNNDIFLKTQKTNSDHIQFDVEVADSEGKTIAWETLAVSNARNGLGSLNEQVSKHYYDAEGRAAATPEQLLALYA